MRRTFGKRIPSAFPLVLVAALLTLPVSGPSQDALQELEVRTHEEVRNILAQVYEILPTLDSSRRDFILTLIAGIEARTGNVKGALGAATSFDSALERDRALVQVVEGLADAGEALAARETADLIHNPEQRDSGLWLLASRQASWGQEWEALDTVNAMKEPAAKSRALASIGMMYARQNDSVGADRFFQLATEAANEIGTEAERARALTEIARMQTFGRNQLGAMRTLDRAQAELSSAEAGDAAETSRASLAEEQARAGLAAEARRTANEMKEEPGRSRALQDIARVQAEAGDFPGALETIASMPAVTPHDILMKAAALRNTAIQQSSRHDIPGALATAERIPANHPLKPETLAYIARLQTQWGDETGAAQTFQRALELAEQLGDDSVRDRVSGTIAEAQAAAGNLPAALETAYSLQNEELRDRAIARIATHQIVHGYAQLALQWSAELNPPSTRAIVLVSVAQELLRQLSVARYRSKRPVP